jgi:HPt (histidine-containing phosphotransfer) domain-containing protein
MNPEHEDLPVVSLTGLGLPEEIKKMYAIGMNAHLIKPLQVGALYTVFKQHLKFSEPAVKPEKKGDIRSYFRNNSILSAKDGLDRASGDVELYLEIIKEFVKLYGDAGDKLNVMLAKDALEDAKKLCLDIRGVAANIGAYPLSETAQQLQETIQLHNGKDAISLTTLFKKQLSELTDELDRLLKDIG